MKKDWKIIQQNGEYLFIRRKKKRKDTRRFRVCMQVSTVKRPHAHAVERW